VIAKALLISGRVVFSTVIPSASSCDNGGTSWLLEATAVNSGGGGSSTSSAYTVLKDPPASGVLTLAPVGLGVTKDDLTLLIGRSDGSPDDKAGNQPEKSTGRQSWRELD
jgi:Tfp pilus tip-associated adhesin PilY1